MNLKKFTQKLSESELSENVPFRAAEMQEAFEKNPKDRLLNEGDNRATRRLKDGAIKLLNNRKRNHCRTQHGHRVLQRMAYYSLNYGVKPTTI